jgi:hypothetical protein
MRRMLGPQNFSLNDESGCLVEGFDTPPAVMMPHSPRWAGPLLEAGGMKKAMDLYAYRMLLRELGAKVKPLADRVMTRGNVRMRKLDTRHYDREIALIVDIFNDAWRANWGFVPLCQAEVDYIAKDLKPFAEFSRILSLDGQEVGMAVCLPNINEIIAGFNGRLLPFNWLKALFAIQFKRYRTGRCLLMGLRQSVQSSPAAGALLAAMLVEGMDLGVANPQAEWIEWSWILETNTRMVRMAEQIAGPPVKIYRLYDIAI